MCKPTQRFSNAKTYGPLKNAIVIINLFFPRLFLFFFLPLTFPLNFLFAQSTNCSTATPVSLSNGNACSNGTTTGAISDNTFYGTCNPSPVTVKPVWYTYITSGSVNDFTVTPGTLTNAEIIIYSGGCPNSAGAILENCTTATGSNPINTTWGFSPGTQVWIGVASVAGTEGTFQLCINSQPPAPNPGNTCALAIPICDKNTFTKPTMAVNSSGQKPSCFGNPAQRDIWYKFTVTQAGALAWKATPVNANDEFDWALWDVSNGCPGTLVCCNYNFSNGSNTGFGMQNVSNNEACGTSGASFFDNAEFSPPINVTCGKTYAIQISNYDNTNNGFSFDWTGSTVLISSSSSFTASPTQVCGDSMSVTINNTSTGTCGGQQWDFGDNLTFNGTAPSPHTYTQPGTYAITSNIPGTCPSTSTQYVQLLAPLAATSISTPTGCSGTCTGSALVNSISGGNGLYTYQWSNGATSSSIDSLCQGSYTVTISNAACGTSIVKTATVGSNATIPAISFSIVDPGCGASNGSATAIPTGGSSPYTFLWSNGQTAPTATALSAGSYSVTITDFNGCNNDTAVVVSTTPSLNLSTSSVGVSCYGGSNGTASVLASNGTNPYTYSWNTSPVQNTATATGLVNGTYSVTVNDAAGCQSTSSVVVTSPSALTVNASGTGVTCQGGNDGSASATAAGGVSPYTFLWDNGQFSPNLNSLQSNTYFVTVTDSNNCQNTASVVVNEGLPVADATITPAGPFCNNETAVQITAADSGGVFSGTGISENTFSPITAGVGSHQVIYTINGLCGDSDTVSILVNAVPDATISPLPALCTEDDSETLLAATAGGTWSGAVNSNVFDPSVSGAGTFLIMYNVNVSGCSASDSITVVVGQSMDATINDVGPFCTYDNAVSLAAIDTGGIWTGTGLNGNIFSPSIAGVDTHLIIYTIGGACGDTDSTTIIVNAVPDVSIVPVANLCSSDSAISLTSATTGGNWNGTGVSGNKFNPSLSGPGSFLIIYSNTVSGCFASDSVTITVNKSMDASISPAGPFCMSSPAVVLNSVDSGGTWSGNGISNSSTGTFDPSVAGNGNHTIIYSINTACGDADTVVISVSEVTINSNLALNVSCFDSCDGEITLNVSGASQYSIDNGASFQAGNVFSNLCAGNYFTRAENNSGCWDTLEVIVTEPAPISLSFLAVDAECFDSCNGYAVVIPLGGSPGYSYSWVATGNSPPISSNGEFADNICSGTYSLTVLDSNGCVKDTSFVIAEPGPNFVSVTATQTNCFGSCDGSATAVAIGNNSPYTFQWDVNAGSQSTATATGLCAGTYIVSAMDTTGCPAADTVVVTEPTQVTVTVSEKDTICIGQSTLINSNAGGGAGDYTYLWDNGVAISSQSVSPAGPQCYSVTATDKNGCESLPGTVCIELYPPLDVTASNDKVICSGDTVLLSANASGGDGIPYTYYWIGSGLSGNSISVNPTGNFDDSIYYPVVVNDGCSPADTDTVVIKFFQIPVPDFNPLSPVVCEGEKITFSSLVPNAVSCSWNMGDGNYIDQCGTFEYLYTDPNNYTVDLTVVTTDGCTTTVSPKALVTINANPSADFTYSPSKPTIANPMIDFTDNSSGQVSSWYWTFSNPENNIMDYSQESDPEYMFPSDTGYYPVKLEVNANNCIDDTTILVYIEPYFQIWIPSAFSPNGDGINDYFIPKGIGINKENFTFYIFDRWGNLIFESHNINDHWDGTAREMGGTEIVKQDVYVWLVIAEEASRTPKKHYYDGRVTLLR